MHHFTTPLSKEDLAKASNTLEVLQIQLEHFFRDHNGDICKPKQAETLATLQTTIKLLEAIILNKK